MPVPRIPCKNADSFHPHCLVEWSSSFPERPYLLDIQLPILPVKLELDVESVVVIRARLFARHDIVVVVALQFGQGKGQALDLLDPEPIERAVTELRAQAYSTVIYFSNRRIDLGFDRFLYLEAHRQRSFASFEDFHEAIRHPAPPPGAPFSKGGA